MTYQRTCRHCGGITETWERDDPCTICFARPTNGPAAGVLYGLVVLAIVVVLVGMAVAALVAP